MVVDGQTIHYHLCSLPDFPTLMFPLHDFLLPDEDVLSWAVSPVWSLLCLSYLQMMLSSPMRKLWRPRTPILIDRAMQAHCRSENTQTNILFFDRDQFRMMRKRPHERGSASLSSRLPSDLAVAHSFLKPFRNFSISSKYDEVGSLSFTFSAPKRIAS